MQGPKEQVFCLSDKENRNSFQSIMVLKPKTVKEMVESSTEPCYTSFGEVCLGPL